MTVLLLLPAVLSFLILGAHYLYQGNLLLMGMCVLAPFILLLRQRSILRGVQLLLVLTFLEWLLTAWDHAQQRMAQEQPFLRMVAILAGVGVFALLGALLMELPPVKRAYPKGGSKAAPGLPPDHPEARAP